ncbi:Bromodomain domain-containing protein [Cephalotus follicularis]|uniref:Bromodomain domain-containing protein n=1 Tax=Cephalotus follicularis TaxID=3775 RepID=A0A1Q3BY76_CEPFO|nr:Bromodomain domain-containing protein [Cephalotus follicularis]
MGQIVKRKKKGRPSKADLARLAAGESTAGTGSDLRRSHRRRSVRYSVIDYDDYIDEDFEELFDDGEEEDERRREKKLKLVVKLNSSSGEARRVHENELSASEDEEESERKPVKKRKIDGSDEDVEVDDDEEEENDNEERGNYNAEERGRNGDSKGHDSAPGTPSEHPSQIPLPDKKTLEFILDKLQKKDTYGVYAEPVDPEELPDYFDVIEHPMDFATVRKNLGNGAYSTLEQFESDVFLICTNAMQYNAPDTIYYKQANSIQELAKKKCQKLRVDFERSEKEVKSSEKEVKSEQKPKPFFLAKKQTKKPLCRAIQEPVGSDFSSGATLANAGDVQNSSIITQAGGCERPRNTNGPVEGYSTVVDNNLEKAEELSSGKGTASKFGRKSSVLDENRRATYNITTEPEIRSESIFTTFEGDNKQLVAVGLHAEYSYARSLARFAATLGPVAWKVASQRIEQALPVECKFGRGWVGEYEPLPTPVLMLETNKQKTPALFAKFQVTSEVRKSDISFKSPVPAKEHSISKLTSEGKPSLFRRATGSTTEGKPSHASARVATPVNAIHKQKNTQSRTSIEHEKKGSKQVELNFPPSVNQNNDDLVVEKKPSNKSEMAAPRSREINPRNVNLLQSVPLKQLDSNGVSAGGLPDGKVQNNSLNNQMTGSSPDSFPTQKARAATYCPYGQEQGLSDPVQLMRMLAGKAQKQQNSSNQSSADTPSVRSPVPSVRKDDSSNAAAAAARAWMSIGAGGYKQAAENSSSPRNQISAESLYNPARELPPQISHLWGEFPLASGIQFKPEENGFPLQPFVPQGPQPVHTAIEPQFQNRPMVFPQLVAADLSKFQMQRSPWQGLSPHAPPRQKQETLPPDLNIGFQSPGSPVKQPSGILVDSQQPDLALQL